VECTLDTAHGIMVASGSTAHDNCRSAEKGIAMSRNRLSWSGVGVIFLVVIAVCILTSHEAKSDATGTGTSNLGPTKQFQYAALRIGDPVDGKRSVDFITQKQDTLSIDGPLDEIKQLGGDPTGIVDDSQSPTRIAKCEEFALLDFIGGHGWELIQKTREAVSDSYSEDVYYLKKQAN